MKKLIDNKFINWIKRHKKISVGILILLLVIGFFLRPKPPEPLETATVKESRIVESLSSTGTIQAENAVDLTFLAGGKVTYVGVKKGDTVEQGQTIATLDTRSAQKNFENAMRDYAKQRNTFEGTKDANYDLTPQTARDEAMRRVLENNQFDLEKAVASVELQEITRQNSVLTSPIDGVVIRADITTPGVNAGIASTYSIVDPDSLMFRIEIDSADVGRVKLGQSVKITLDAYPETPISAQVTGIDFASHKTDTGGNAFYVDVMLPLGTYDYRLGMGGDAEILLAEKRNTLIVPIATLEDEKFVYVKKEKGFEKRAVKVGLMSDTEAEIRTGLQRGEVVAVQPEEAAKQLIKK